MCSLQIIQDKIQDMIDSNHLLEASELYLSTITELLNINSPILGEFYFNYGLLLFDMQEYEMSVLMLQSAYRLNYKKNEIISLIYDAFVVPNQDEFQMTYETTLAIYPESITSSYIPHFEELTLDFIAVGEDKYYIFDKHTMTFEGLFDIKKEKTFNKTTFSDEFSDIVLLDFSNLNTVDDIIRSAKNRLLYMIPSDLNKLFSFFKIPSLMEIYCNNLMVFESFSSFQNYFHINTSSYLPHIHFCIKKSSKKNIVKIIENEHEFRLTKEGRNRENILLTIGIPSYNRGHRALQSILNLLTSKYDSEIEFVLSDNCSTKNIEGYQKIETLKDSRVKYFKSPQNCGASMNFSQVINISNGKYTCLLSDEDHIYVPGIAHYLSILRNNSNITCIRSCGTVNYTINSNKITPKGKKAFLNSFLSSNYVSGLIYRTDIFHKLWLHAWTKNNLDNKSVEYYCHSCWIMFYSFWGDYYEDSNLLIQEGHAEENSSMLRTTNSSNPFLPYSTLESRIEQHNGFIEVLNQLIELIDKETYLDAYIKLCNKSFFLLTLVKDKYLSTEKKWNNVCEEMYHCCLSGIHRCVVPLSEEDISILQINITNYYIYLMS